IANDTSNNLNTTETTNFTANDVTPPSIYVEGCIPDPANISNIVFCNATIIDETYISSVMANITLPNGTVQVMTVTNYSSNYTFNFSNTFNLGQHNVTWLVNDTSNNKQTASDNFTVNDTSIPEITINSPYNYYNTSNTTMIFNFTSIDTYNAYLNCSIKLDSIINKTNTTTMNGTSTYFTIQRIQDGVHYWNISCNDNSSNTNTSETREFIIDLSNPSFISLTTEPSTAADLDPGINITVYANITTNLSPIETVILQYRLNNTLSYTNLSMDFNTTTRLYFATLNATNASIYTFRVYANKTVGNGAFSNQINRSIEYDYNWTRSPISFNPISTTINSNVTLGNLTINNTGDFTLNFNLSSSSAETIFNTTTNFNLSAKSIKIVEVNDTATVYGVKTLTINISTNKGFPSSQTTSGTIVVAPGQPVLSVTFTTPSSETLSTTQGDSGIEFTAKVENIGEGNATNVTLNISTPNEWLVTFGDSFLDIGELLSGDEEENTIEISIPTNATSGNFIVIANATGQNETGENLTDLGLVFGDTVLVTVNKLPSEIGEEEKEETQDEPSAPSSPSVITAASSSGEVSKVDVGKKVIHTKEEIFIVRGNLKDIPLSITNLYQNAVLEDISIEIGGFLSKHIRITPLETKNKLVNLDTQSIEFTKEGQIALFQFKGLEEHKIILDRINKDTVSITIMSDPINITLKTGETKRIDLNKDNQSDIGITLVNITNDKAFMWVHRLGMGEPDKIYFLEDKNYTYDIFAPAYLDRNEINLTLLIKGKLTAVNPEAAGFKWSSFLEHRTVNIKIVEVAPENASSTLAVAREALKEMTDAGFPTTKVKELLEKAEHALQQTYFGEAFRLSKEIINIKETAFEAHSLIEEIKNSIKKANERELTAPETERAIVLAQKAFDREDFETALERAKEAKISLILETKGRINIIWFLKTYWWAVILSLAAISVLLFFMYKKLMLKIYSERLKNLAVEETSIRSLIEETQKSYMVDKEISSITYHKLMMQYQTRLAKIEQIRAKLKHKRISLLKTEQQILNLKKEEKEIYDLIKKIQTEYYEKRIISRNKFLLAHQSYLTALADIDEERELLKERIEKKKKMKKYKIITFFYKILRKQPKKERKIFPAPTNIIIAKK
ncbi:MAG: hypothetical protein ACTSWZ_03155, partial [Candidatus Heimdallarchaeaceae archaeon]